MPKETLDITKVMGLERSKEDIMSDAIDKCYHIKNHEILMLEVLLDIRDKLDHVKNEKNCEEIK